MKKYVFSRTYQHPEGHPPKNLIQTFRRRYEHDLDANYGHMFLIPPDQLDNAIQYADKYDFELYEDPDDYNKDWYYLMWKD